MHHSAPHPPWTTFDLGHSYSSWTTFSGVLAPNDIVYVARQRFEAIGSSLAPVAAAKSALVLAVDSAHKRNITHSDMQLARRIRRER